MDKNMINIDDLFRQRLSGGEEKERPGAWLQMRDLLDKEMPVSAPRGNAMNWRRMFGYAAGLVLLASVTVGSYKAITSFRDVENSIGNQVNSSTSSRNASGSVGGMATQPGTATSQDAATAASGNTSSNTLGSYKGLASNKTVTNKSIASNNSTTKSGHVADVSGNDKTAINSNNTNQAIATATVSDKKDTKTTTTKQSDLVATAEKTSKPTTTKQSDLVATAEKTSKPTTTDNKSTIAKKASTGNVNNRKSFKNNDLSTIASSENSNKTSTSAIVAQQPVATTPKPVVNNTPVHDKAYASGNSVTAGNKPSVAPRKETTTNNTGSNALDKRAIKNEIAKNNNEKKNLIDKVEARETYDRKTGQWKKDTIDKGKIEWAEEEPVMVAKVKGEDAAMHADIVPAASVQATAENNNEKLVPLSNFRTSAKKGNYETTNIFEEMVKNAKMQLGSVKFYPGLIAGINTAMSGKNSMTGFQVGATGTLSLNEKWGITAELKYIQRFRNGNRESNRNDYLTNIQTSTSGGTRTYSWDSVVSYFTYPTVSSFELPLMVKYSFKRINVLAGGSLAYHMGFSPNHVENPYSVSSYTPPAKPAEGAIVTPADFGSRFGVGYLFGVGYQVSPAIQLDMRMTQSLWDNAAGAGAEKISKEIYQIPSLQLNMSYRFSSNKYMPYRSH